jgi:hypothetical protein
MVISTPHSKMLSHPLRPNSRPQLDWGSRGDTEHPHWIPAFARMTTKNNVTPWLDHGVDSAIKSRKDNGEIE